MNKVSAFICRWRNGKWRETAIKVDLEVSRKVKFLESRENGVVVRADFGKFQWVLYVPNPNSH